MINILHTPQENNQNRYTIEGDSIEELLPYCVAKIRQHSKAFYEREIREDLEKNNEALVDSHAGMGYTYSIKLIR
jgi:hypothetical protein